MVIVMNSVLNCFTWMVENFNKSASTEIELKQRLYCKYDLKNVNLLLASGLAKMDLSNYTLGQLCSLSEKLEIQLNSLEHSWVVNYRRIPELYSKCLLLEQVKAHINLKQCNRSESEFSPKILLGC